MDSQGNKDKPATIIHSEYLECRERIYQGYDLSDQIDQFNNFARGVMAITKINNEPIELAELEISESNKYLEQLK